MIEFFVRRDQKLKEKLHIAPGGACILCFSVCLFIHPDVPVSLIATHYIHFVINYVIRVLTLRRDTLNHVYLFECDACAPGNIYDRKMTRFNEQMMNVFTGEDIAQNCFALHRAVCRVPRNLGLENFAKFANRKVEIKN